MTPEQFTYWLQGWSELSGATPTEAQWKSIKEHLQTVFKKVTPNIVVPNTGSGTEIDFFNPKPEPYPYNPDPNTPPYQVIC